MKFIFAIFPCFTFSSSFAQNDTVSRWPVLAVVEPMHIDSSSDKDSPGPWLCSQPPCIDSEYVVLLWTGDVDKPYAGLIFHRAHSWFQRPRYEYLIPFEASESQFGNLVNLINNSTKPKDWNSSMPVHYLFAVVRSDSILGAVRIYEKRDLVNLATQTLSVFRNTEHFALLRSKWSEILARFALTLPISPQH